MPGRKRNEQNIRKLTRLGGKSLGLTIPVDIVRKLKLRDRQKVTVKSMGKKIIIEDWTG